MAIMKKFENGLGNFIEQSSRYKSLEDRGILNIRNLKQYLNSPEYQLESRSFTISDAELMTNIPRSSIRDKEKKGELIYNNNHDYPKKYYTPLDINQIRSFFKKGFFNGKIIRPAHLDPIVIAVSMFKGGVGKTTHSTHLAVHSCLQGLRTLLIDLDPQASSSFVFGFTPSVDIESGQTILKSLLEDPSHIKSVIKQTYYKGLDIIISGLELQAADLLLPNNTFNNISSLGSPLFRLFKAIQEIKQNYDIIILDCAPNHASTTMNALTAAQGIIIPIEPTMLAYGSSIQFIHTLKDLSDSIINYRDSIINNDIHKEIPIIDSLSNSLFRILITNDPGDKEAQDVSASIRSLYGDLVLPRPMCRSIALSRSSNDMGLLYDLKRSNLRGSKEAFDRGLQSMKAVNNDIITIIKTMWDIDNA